MTEELEKLNTIKETCEILKLSKFTIYKMIKEKILLTVPYGNVQRVRQSEIDRILTGNQRKNETIE